MGDQTPATAISQISPRSVDNLGQSDCLAGYNWAVLEKCPSVSKLDCSLEVPRMFLQRIQSANSEPVAHSIGEGDIYHIPAHCMIKLRVTDTTNVWGRAYPILIPTHNVVRATHDTVVMTPPPPDRVSDSVPGLGMCTQFWIRICF